MKLIAKSTLIIVIIAVCSVAFAAEGPWVLKQDKSGIKVYVRDIGLQYQEMKAEGTVDIPFEVLVEVGRDYDRYVEWYGMCKELKAIKKKTENDFDVYFILDMPVVKNRDAVLNVKINTDYQKGICNISLKSFDNDYGKENNLVRMPRVEGTYTITRISPTQSKAVYQVYADVASSVPMWIIKSTSLKHPFDTLKGARKQAQKPEYVERANKLHNKTFVLGKLPE